MFKAETKRTNTKIFAEQSAKKIIISRRDMNAALFMGKHYSCDFPGNQQIFMSKSVDVTITAPQVQCHRPRNQSQSDYIVHCTLRDLKNNKLLDMAFKQKGYDLEFIKGTIGSDKGPQTPESITSAKTLGNTLAQIYKTVRSEVDKKWAADLEIAREAREMAGQRLDTGMMPGFELWQGRSETIIRFASPCREQMAHCQKKCNKCKLKVQ